MINTILIFQIYIHFRFPEEVPAFEARTRSGRPILIEPLIRRTMIDGKMKAIISGRAGAYCASCNQTAGSYYSKQSKYLEDPLVSTAV